MKTAHLDSNPYIATYREIMPDPEAFLACIGKPLPQTMHVNTLKTSREFVQMELACHGIHAKPMAWHPAGLRVEGTAPSIGNLWTYQAGLYQTQEEASLIPATLLDPQPGERVLDLCAAPGGKTVQMAVMMQNTGTIIANDRSYQRIRALGHMIKRLGITNVATTARDGLTFPACREFFDKILVDAPCTCDGTLRKQRRGHVAIQPDQKNSLAMSRMQLALLRQAVSRVRPGGRIVYSTCTLAPEENEHVIHQLLNEYAGSISLKPIALPGLQYSRGITRWNGETFDDSLKHSLRLWPHQNDSGGFFVAVLEKAGQAERVQPEKQLTLPVNDPNVSIYLASIQDRFGISDDALQHFETTYNKRRGVSFLSKGMHIPTEVPVDSAGLFAIKTEMTHPKLSTPVAMMLAPFATRHHIQLTREQRDDYLARRDLVLTNEQRKQCGNTGYVMVSYAGIGLGLALYLSHRDQCQSLCPKSL